MRQTAAVVGLLFFVVMAASVFSVPTEAAESTKNKSPWRGSSIVYRNEATAISVDKGADPTYNPYYAMTLGISPRWWFGDHITTFASIDVTRELTHEDGTTYSGEYVWGDLIFGVAGSQLVTIPGAGITITPTLSLTAPTSKYSQARTMYLSVRPELAFGKTFDVLSGISIGYGIQGTKFFNEFTTGELENPVIPSCTGLDCARYMNNGLRNTSWRMVNYAAVSVDFTDWLGISSSVAWIMDWLYKMEEADDSVTFEPQDSTDNRYMMSYGLELYSKPMKSLGIALGASTTNPQLAPDSTMRTPFFNRYTTIYFDLKFDLDGFISQLSSAEEE